MALLHGSMDRKQTSDVKRKWPDGKDGSFREASKEKPRNLAASRISAGEKLTDCRASSDMSSASRVTHTGSIVLEGQIDFVVPRSHDMIPISMSASGIAVRPWEPTRHTALIASAAASVPTFLGAILWSSFARAAVRVHVDADVCASFPRVPAMHCCGEPCHKKGSSTVLGRVCDNFHLELSMLSPEEITSVSDAERAPQCNISPCRHDCRRSQVTPP